jgi:hypothetical protein
MTPDITDALSAIMNNPELMESIRSVASQHKDDDKSEGDRHDDNSVKEDYAGKPDSAEASSKQAGIPSIPPELLASLPKLMKSAGPLLGRLREHQSGGKKGGGHGFGRHEHLLKALKPYLSESRREAVDLLADLAELAEAFDGFGFLGGLGKGDEK